MTINDTDQSHLLKDLTFTEKADYEKGFSAYFEEKIKPELEPLEKKRKEQISVKNERKKTLILTIIITIIIGIPVFFFLSPPVSIFVGGAILFLVYDWAIKEPEKEYISISKKTILPHIVAYWGNFIYKESGNIPINKLSNSKLFLTFTSSEKMFFNNAIKIKTFAPNSRYKSEDYICGTYKNIKIETVEASLLKPKKTNATQERNTIFKGIFILLQINKKIQGQTIVTTDKGFFKNWIKGKLINFERVRLEDPKFENMFEIFSSDQVEARYLLTTAFMERFLHLAKIYNSNEIQCSFFDDQIFITIPSTQNLFEPQGPEKSIINTDDIHTFLEQMHSIFQIVDVLKLNQKIGM